MAYKTILVQLNDPERAAALVAAAVQLAQRFEAHLIGLHVSPGMLYVPPLPSAGGIVSLIEAHERRISDRIREVFEQATRGRPFVAEMRVLNPKGRDDLAAIVLQHARAVDLIIASQATAGLDATSALDFPERLAVESGRPVLMVPPAGVAGDFGRRIVVAWNGSRESTRATFDAMPLLVGAARVTLLGIAQLGPDGEVTPLPDMAIGATLARHDVHVSIENVNAVRAAIGAQILDHVTATGSDMLVMGAYGHSRLSEFVFGGATRFVVRNATVPTLFAH